jgi:hypothetical protein
MAGAGVMGVFMGPDVQCQDGLYHKGSNRVNLASLSSPCEESASRRFMLTPTIPLNPFFRGLCAWPA